MALLNLIYVGAAVVFLFGAAVFVHEFGHYWVARKRGLKVEEFAIGFGPKIFSWTRDGILYSWRWIPAGGFVKLPQMVTSEALEGKTIPPVPAWAKTAEKPIQEVTELATQINVEPATPDPDIPPASPLSKILVAFAGPFMNIVFAFVIAIAIYFVGLPILVNPSIIGHVDPESPEGKLGIREGDMVVEVNGKPVKSWQDVQMTTILSRTNLIPVGIERAGVRTNYLLKAEVNPGIVEAGFEWKMLNLDPKDHPEIIEVLSGGSAEAAGLKAKDVILAFNGVPVASREQLIDLIHRRAGKESEIRFEREDKKMALMVTPKMDPSTQRGRIGVSLGNRSGNVYQVMKPGPHPWDQIVDVWNQTVDTFSALWHSKQTGVGAKDLSGPVGILSMLAIQVNTDYRLALKFLVLLNVNLAILNLLPLPVLDGGHIMLSIIERIRRRPLSPRIMEYATTAFAVLLISFMLYVTFFDIKRWSVFRSMFKQSSQIENVEQTPAQAPTETPAQPAPAKP
jgi:regulator of sigma E protease